MPTILGVTFWGESLLAGGALTLQAGETRPNICRKTLLKNSFKKLWAILLEFARPKLKSSTQNLLCRASGPTIKPRNNKGTRGTRARCDAEHAPFISIVSHTGRPSILGMDERLIREKVEALRAHS